MFNKGLISLFLAIGIIVIVGFTFNMRGPDISQYAHLTDPAVRTMPSQRVLVVEAKGPPDIVAKKAFGLLYKTYFSLKGVPKKGKSVPAPRARWPQEVSLPQSEWTGRYAMPLPDTIRESKLPGPADGLTVRLATWKYGSVAEILHTGPYDKEEETIGRLHSFIKNTGYDIIGEHEEEYLRGPGMLIRGNPAKYMTIIRYRIKKSAGQELH